jgi:hypothetical protein
MTFKVLALSALPIGYMLWERAEVRQTVSALAEELAQEPANKPDLMRDAFAKTMLTPLYPVAGHTHPKAAAIRSAATNFARDMAMYAGVDLFSVEMSKSDQRKGIRGSRRWFWAKDTNVRAKHDFPRTNDIELMVDVDYYFDVPRFLADRAKPLLIYTVVPQIAVGVATDDTTILFNEAGELETIVAGGGKYQHHLWDYSGDSLIAEKTFFGLTYSLTTYAIERRQVAFSRQLILLTPIKHFKGFSAFLASYLLDGKRLKRFNPIVTAPNGDKFIRFRVHSNETTVYTTARPSTHLCATVDAEIDDAVAAVARLGTTNLVLPTTASWVKSRSAAVMLTEFHRHSIKAKVPTVYPVSEGVRTYQYSPSTFDSSAKAKLQSFMSPLVHSAFAPANHVSSEVACVDGRVNNLKKEEPAPSAFVTACLHDFVGHVCGDVLLEPFDVETVVEKQTTMTQKLSLKMAMLFGPITKRVLKCFVKSEAYADVKDPRNISMYNDKDKLTMATFALALSKHLKQFSWYGPGKTPIEVAERVAEICSQAEFANISDYHRMDGTITYFLRQVDRAVFMKAFGNHRDVLNDLLDRNCDNIGILPYGTTFEQGPSHGSGCSATSTSQTLRSAFAAYLGFRNQFRPDGSRYTSLEAFNALGVHLGDDGIDANLTVRSHGWAARKVGLVLEAGVVLRGQRGITFLARFYSPYVWYGCLDSMCDVKRQLSKFHTTVRLPENVRPEQKLVEKASGYVATDANTPVIGALCKRAVELIGFDGKPLPINVKPWWAYFDASVQFPNANTDGWMDAEFSVQFPEFDRSIFDNWLQSVNGIAELLAAPLCAEPKSATPALVPVVVDNDVLPARSTLDSAEATVSQQDTSPSNSQEKRGRKSASKARRKSKLRAPAPELKCSEPVLERPPNPTPKSVRTVLRYRRVASTKSNK